MNTKKELLKKAKRVKRSRGENNGTDKKPRMVIFRSNKYISAQLLDDFNQKVILGVTEKAITDDKKLTKTEKAKLVGAVLGKTALEKGIKNIIFDRRGYKYHGRVKALADGARSAGLIF